MSSFYAFQLPEKDDDEERDEEEEEINSATLQRLKTADERTKNMTREEYVHWSECRQASFTFRKGKRFREWAGFGIVTDSKPNDDIVDILGFLTFEIVQTLTEEALRVKAAEDAWARDNDRGEGGRGKDNVDSGNTAPSGTKASAADKSRDTKDENKDSKDEIGAKKENTPASSDSRNGSNSNDVPASAGPDDDSNPRKRKREMGLFDPPEKERAPVQPKHIQEAFRRLQQPSAKERAMRNLGSWSVRRPLKFVSPLLI